MAQGFITSNGMRLQGGQESEQSADLVMTSGKYSIKYPTAEKAQNLKDKNTRILMALISEFRGKGLDMLKQWASQSWAISHERISGLAALEYNAAILVQKLLVKLGSDALPPNIVHAKESQRQHMLIRAGVWPSSNVAN